MLLNNDAVFLAELLMSYEGAPEWGSAYRSFNCLAKPEDVPEVLDYAAAVTIVLAHYRAADHIEDSGSFLWSAIARFLSPRFRKASAWLRESGFDVDALDRVLRSQKRREVEARSLDDVAEPTSIATAIVFGHRRPELYNTGYAFGRLIYVLDAFEDRAKDERSGAFNALNTFGIDGRAEVLAALERVDLPPAFRPRLQANVEERLGMRMRVLCCAARRSWKDRWREAVSFARSMRQREAIGAAVFASAVAIAFLFPHHAKGSLTSRECLTVPLNLMALGTFFATPAGVPKKKGCGCLDSCGGCCDGADCGDCCCDASCCCDGCSC
jgi:hypothetical protein